MQTSRRKRFSFVSRFLIYCLVSIGSLCECQLSRYFFFPFFFFFFFSFRGRKHEKKRWGWFIKIPTLSQFFLTSTPVLIIRSRRPWWSWTFQCFVFRVYARDPWHWGPLFRGHVWVIGRNFGEISPHRISLFLNN